MQSVVGSVASLRVIGSYFQSPVCQSLVSQGPRIPKSQVLSLMAPGSRVLGSQVSGYLDPGSQGREPKGLSVPGLKVPDPGFQVLILDYAVLKYVLSDLNQFRQFNLWP